VDAYQKRALWGALSLLRERRKELGEGNEAIKKKLCLNSHWRAEVFGELPFLGPLRTLGEESHVGGFGTLIGRSPGKRLFEFIPSPFKNYLAAGESRHPTGSKISSIRHPLRVRGRRAGRGREKGSRENRP